MTTLDLKENQINSVIELFSKGEINQALDAVQDLFKDYPNEPLLLNISGACHAGLGQLDAAVKDYGSAIAIKPDYAKAHFNLAGALQDLGQLEAAVNSYEKSIKIEPAYAEAHNNLGSVLKELKQDEAAVKSYKQALVIKPDYVEAQYSLGIMLQDLGQLEAAIKCYEVVLVTKPNFADAFNNLATAFLDLGQFDAAVKSYKSAIKIKPDFVAAINNLGIAFYKLHQTDEAISCYKQALALNPNFADAYNNLGAAFLDLGQLNEAVKSYKSALKVKPDSVDAFNNLGTAFFDLGQFDAAVKSYKSALKINPDFVKAINNLGIAFYKLHQTDEAINCYKQALALNPKFADAHNNLGMVLLDLGQFDAAVKSYKSALKIKPDFVAAINNLGIAFYKLQQEDEAIKCYKKAISLKPDFVDAYANLASVMKVLNRFDEALAIYESEIIQNSNLDFILGELFHMKMHLCIWDDLPRRLDELKNKINNNEKVISPFILLALVDDPEIQRKNTEIYVNYKFPNNNVLPAIGIYPKHSKIRIGYFSADFREHPVSSLTAELYEMHNRNEFEIYAFSFGPNTNDGMNLRIKAGVDHFHDVRSLSHKEIVLLARSFEIDIAIDLGGYTQNARTEIFAMSAAPIQASYIGVLSTMGADYYDYLFAGQTMIPENNQKYYTEKIVYLPSYQVNDSKELPPEINFTRKELGLPEKGLIFCCFNNTYKIMPTVFNSWARILKDVKESVLFIYVENELAKINLTKEIIIRGVDPSRLIFGGRLPRPEYLARYRIADLFLDTRPYNAGTTASDALRMGLPVLTMEGSSFNSREAASIIRSLNLPELITSSEKEYETLAVELGNDPEKLKFIKEKLASNLSTAPLYDTPMFTKNLESAFAQMYYRYQQGLEPNHIYLKQENSKVLK